MNHNIAKFVCLFPVAVYFMYSGVQIFRSKNELANLGRDRLLPYPEITVKLGGGLAIGGGAFLLIPPLTLVGLGCLLVFLLGCNVCIHRLWKSKEVEPALANFAWIGLLSLAFYELAW